MAEKSCFTISEFCREHGNMSRPLLYRLWDEGRGPRRMQVGRRVLITREAAEDWRRQMESESNHASVGCEVL